MLIKNGKIITPFEIVLGDVRVENGKIVEVGENLTVKNDEIVQDVSGNFVTPGFIDIHSHGGYGSDFMDATDEAFNNALKFHADNGTTTVLPTSCTAPVSDIKIFLDYTKKYLKNPNENVSKVLGVHLEGPYLSERNRGAQKLEDLKVPSRDGYDFILDYIDVVKSVTIAPELDGADKMCKDLSSKGILMCGGHDDGVYPEFMPAIENGLSHVTHLYCVTSDVRFKNGVRNVGLREYALIDDRLSVELIADDKHIPQELLKMIVRAKGTEKICLVSDSLRCAGLANDGTIYSLGSGDGAQKVYIDDGVAKVYGVGNYAGSITSVRQMIKNVMKAGVGICSAVRMATINPAKVIGEEKNIGSIEVGKCADLCVLNEDFEVEKIIINGRLI